MTEADLTQRGFPGGDVELLAAYRKLCGEPAFIVKDPEWVRDLMFEEVQQELRRQASGAAKPVTIGERPLGSWHEPE